ncbi:MAG: porin [Candidatus Latescibacterota bacterium]
MTRWSFALGLVVWFGAGFVSCGKARADDLLDNVEAYGSFRSHLAAYEDVLEVQNNGSRLGVRFQVPLSSGITFLGLGEISVNLVENNVEFNASTSTHSDFVLRRTSTRPFGPRLGYVGIDFGRFGQLQMGKVWSVYSDISRWTQAFHVFGGEASGTYPGGTDGGLNGTGRAEKALAYRAGLGRLRVGVQGQFRGVDTGQLLDSAGAAAWVDVGFGLSIGGAYNRYNVATRIKPFLINEGDTGGTAIAGVRFETSFLYVAAIYATQDKADAVVEDSVAVAFSSEGVEVYAHVNIDRVRILGGFNYLQPEDVGTGISDRFEVHYYVAGVTCSLRPSLFLYTEMRFDLGNDPTGRGRANIYTLGLEFDIGTQL